MIINLEMKNFTVFADANLHFGRNLNVIIGENGVGKSHILKLAYSILATSAEGPKESGEDTPTKSYLATALAKKLRRVFRPDELGRLASRQSGRNRCEVSCKFADGPLNTAFSFHTASKSAVEIEQAPKKWLEKKPVFFPTRELLTIYPGFVALYETTNLNFEETWRDTCILLGALVKRGPKANVIGTALAPLEKAMGGSIELTQDGKFYLNLKQPKLSMEMNLVAEGLRKLAMVARLIATGSLHHKGYLFWDEPEANLNPRLIKEIAGTIIHLAQNGIQVFVATHSLFLLRELHILQKQGAKNLDTRCFGLHVEDSGIVSVKQGKSMDEVGNIASLDEDLAQSERYMDTEMGLPVKTTA